MPQLVSTLGAVILGVLLVGWPAPAAQAADVHGDDERDRYVGTGGLVLPGTTDESTRREVAGCTGCSWRMTSPCVASVLGNAFGSGCTSVVRGCPGGELLRAWFRPADRPWREVALVCVGPGGPVTVARAGRAAAERVARGIPALEPAFQPPHGVLAQLPVRFSSGQTPGDHTFGLAVLASEVSVVARPTWSWWFGDGSQLVDSAGRVEHVYRVANGYEATCRSTWSAHFTVDGLGPFPVPEPVVQTVSVAVPVGEGRALLVPG